MANKIIKCTVCGKEFSGCGCGSSPNKCSDCIKIYQKELAEKMRLESIERDKKIESGEIKLLNIADIDAQFCRGCGLPKNWCSCPKV